MLLDANEIEITGEEKRFASINRQRHRAHKILKCLP